MAVVKGNAYGHGIEPCVQAMDDLCDWYGTATMQEALRVRSVSGEKPILVFGYVSDEEIHLAAENNITLSAFSATFLSHISECCAGMNLKAAVHLKLDTGFHRMGIDCCSSIADCVEQLLPLFSLPNIEITGMYTHLVYGAGSNQRELAFTELQFQRFQSCIRALQERKIDTGICHICNSKAAIHAPDMHMDMVRVGAYIFGLASASEQRLIPLREVLVWKARIVLLRDIAAGEGGGLWSCIYRKTACQNRSAGGRLCGWLPTLYRTVPAELCFHTWQAGTFDWKGMHGYVYGGCDRYRSSAGRGICAFEW